MRKLNILASCLAIGAFGLSAMAQDNPPPPRGKDRPAGGQPGGPGGGGGGMRGMQLSPEKAKAAQEAEATGVAKRLGLNDAQTKTLVNAYVDARTSQAAALQKARKDAADKNGDDNGGGGRRGGAEMMKAMEDVNKVEREKFDKALGTNIPADAKTKVMASLGSFPIVWDRMVDTLSDFKLDAKKQQDALNAIEDFVVAQGKARGGDQEEMRTAMQGARTTLSDAMKKILTEEQFTKFQQSMGGGGRGQRGGGPGGGGGGGGGGGF